VDRLTRLLLRCASDTRGAVSLATHAAAKVDSIEIHSEGRGAAPGGRTWTIRDFVDLTPLGAGRNRGPTQLASVWPSSWLTAGTERSLVLEALRDNALDWGYLDSDPAMTQLGWQAGQLARGPRTGIAQLSRPVPLQRDRAVSCLPEPSISDPTDDLRVTISPMAVVCTRPRSVRSRAPGFCVDASDIHHLAGDPRNGG
jgi:hypothetical protein